MTNITDAPEGGKTAIRKAITAVAKSVTRVSKSSRNTEQKYDFASIDDFLAMTGPIMAENGLFVMIDEEEVTDFERQGKYGASFWLRIKFLITVCHESGEEMKPVRRTVEVVRTGAQSFGSAQSYVLKQFQRALFNIPTGDKDDADFAERGDGPAVKTQKPVEEEATKLDADNRKKVQAMFDKAVDKDQADKALAHYQERIPEPFHSELREIHHDAITRIEAAAPADANPYDGVQ